MSGFEGSAEAAWLNGAIGKRNGLIQGRNEGAAIGYHAGWDDGVAEGQQQATRAAQAQLDAMHAQVAALQAELSSTRAAYQRVNAKWAADKEFLAGLMVVATATQEALKTASLAQNVEFLREYARCSQQFKAEGHITCDPAQSPRFRQDMPSTVSFVNRVLSATKAPALAASSTPSP